LHSSIGDDYGDAFHKDWIPLGHEDVLFSSFMIVDDELPLCGIFSIDELYDYCVGGGSGGEDEEGDEHNIERVPSFTKAHTAYKTVKPFLYVHSISEHER